MDHNDIEMTDLEGEQRELAETVGITAYRKLVQVYAGQFVYISKAETVLLKKRNQRIRADTPGKMSGSWQSNTICPKARSGC